MQDRRLLTFLLTATLIMLGYFQLQLILNPPKPAAEDVAEAVAPDDVDEDQAELPLDDRVAAEVAADTFPVDIADWAPNVVVPRQRVVLGSLDPNSPFEMAVYFTNQGAAIERIELNSPQYRDLVDRSGYLGNLSLSDDPRGGCRVGTVAPGSPASLAAPVDSVGGPQLGLRAATFSANADDVVAQTTAGDRIVQLDDTEVADVVGFQEAMSSTRPGQSVTLTVIRTRDGADHRLQFRCQLVKRPLSLLAPENGFDADLAEPDQLSFLWTLGRFGDARVGLGKNEIKNIPSLWEANWETRVLDDGQGIEFSRRLTAADLGGVGGESPLEMVKRYRLTPVDRSNPEDKHGSRGYAINLELELRNLGNVDQKLAYQLDGPTGLPLEGWWYSYKVHPTAFSGAGARDVVWRKEGGNHELFVCSKITRNALEDEKDPFTPLAESSEPIDMKYAGCDAQYFAVVLQPATDADGNKTAIFSEAVCRPVGPLDEKKKKRTNSTFRLTSETLDLSPGETYAQQFEIFAGPKHTDVLAEFGLGDCIVYGWFWMVAQPMLKVLHVFHSILPVWGLCIILLTVLVRGSLFPLGRKMALNAQKMQELAPEMKAIAEKYKNDMEKRSAAQRELFSKNNYNPFAGCLVMFIQLPIFIGLYRSLSVDIELRQAPFFPGLPWCSNLAGPDFFWHWENIVPWEFITSRTGLLGPYLNILPIITVVLFLVQQKMFTPPPQDEQQEMQQKVMKFMMLFMGVLFHKVAAGLCVYFIASSLWGIAERKLLPKTKLGTAEAPSKAKPALVTPAASSNGSGSPARKKRRKKRRK